MDKIVPCFQETLFKDNKDIFENIVEFGIDSVLEEGLLKDIPIVGFFVGAKNAFQNLQDRNLLNQTLQFIKEFNLKKIDAKKIEKYKNKISNSKQAEKELGRVLIILNSIIDIEKSKMLAKVFRYYVDEKINWDEFCEFSEIIKNIYLNDINYFEKIYFGKIKSTVNYPLYPFDRLVSLGLINTSPKGLYPVDPDGDYYRQEKFVSISKIGGKFYESIKI